MDWVDFVLARYNYWIVIILMMTGLYIVYARGNLVKKIVGLNLFQTSVFIFYITIGKIANGTAPIYIGGELDHGGGHGAGEGAGESDDHGAAHEVQGDGAHQEEAGALGDASAQGQDAPLHAAPDADAVNAADKIANATPADLKSRLQQISPEGAPNASLHVAPDSAEKISNEVIMEAAKPDAHHFETAGAPDMHGVDAANPLGAAAHYSSEVIYTNPLPHVLILTAIVVGVATTAVGLALAVRIREAYSTIEEDELEAIDNIAEFGEGARGAGSEA